MSGNIMSYLGEVLKKQLQEARSEKLENRDYTSTRFHLHVTSDARTHTSLHTQEL